MTAQNSKLQVSVVVPVRNEGESIRALLEGLLGQTFAPTEILITDGGSQDNTVEIIEEFIAGGAPLKLFRETDSMPGHARNVGARNASCEWIAFTDAGTVPARDWLEALVEKVSRDPDVDVVYGAFEPITDTVFKQCAVMAYLQPPALLEGRLTPPPSIASALMRRAVWATAGGFPSHLRSAEDLIFMERVAQHAARPVRAPRARVYWAIQPTLWRTFKRFVTYARNNMRAGLWRQWQATVLARYGLLLLAALPAIWFGWKWLLVPLSLWLLLLIARSFVAIRRYRQVYPASVLKNLVRLAVLVPIMATLDSATILGTIQWLVADKIGGQGGAEVGNGK